MHGQNSPQHYVVTVVRDDESGATAQVRHHTFRVNIKRGGGEAGPNAAETLLVALGTCLLTNVQTLAAKMRIELQDVRVEVEGVRRDVPPGLIGIHYTLSLTSDAPLDKLEYLHEKAAEWGTVTNTLVHGVAVEGEVELRHP